MQAGVDDFLAKPIEPGAIWRRLFVAERFIKFTTEIKELQRLVPICMHCRKIRRDEEYWHDVETYIQEHAGSELSHGVCPDCRTEGKTESEDEKASE